MTNQPANSQPFGEPPPLPPNNGNTRSAPVLVAIVVSIALVLLIVLLLMLMLNEPVPLAAQSDGKGGDPSGVAKQKSGDSLGGDQPGNAKSGVLDDGGSARQSTDDPEASGNGQQVAATDEDGGRAATTRDDEAAPVPGASDDQASKVSPGAMPDTDTTEQVPGNQFFTLGDRKDRVERSDASEESISNSTTTSEAFSGRVARGKEGLLQAQGGTTATEAAVKLGLEWLAKNQQANGLWSLNGPYENGSPTENNAAATAMALLAFQGAGHTHQGDASEAFTRVVSTGSSALLKHVFSNENLNDELGQGGGYTQAMCTMAVCELYGMTHDRRLRKPALQTVEYCLAARSPQGGWRYTPRQDSDTSVTGWFVMGLQSARMSGLKVSDQAFEGVSMYLNAAANKYGSRYSYQPGVPATPSMTAEALLCRQYLGWKRDDSRLQDGTQYLLTQLPDWKPGNRDVYYWYYATQVCHHMGGDYWQRWNTVMRDVLPANQVHEGQERGSWDPRGDHWGSQGGRLYVTCMSLYMLEVYYRYLPLYQDAAVRNR